MEQKPDSEKSAKFENMAHRAPILEQENIDMFIKKAKDVGESKSRIALISNLSGVFFDLEQFKSAYRFNSDDVRNERDRKINTFGGLTKGVMSTSADGRAKLVRDKYPKIPPEDGKVYKYSNVKGDELRRMLNEKLVEECQELVVAKLPEKRLEEIADIYEVLDAVLRANDVNMKEITPRLHHYEFQKIRGSKNLSRRIH